MDKIKIKIDGRIAEIESAPEVVTDNAEYEVEFSVDERDGWNPTVPMTALFVRRDARYTAVVMDAGETICTMPPQTGTNIVFVGLTQDDLRTTTPATIKVRRSIRTVANDPLPAPTEDVYAQILAAYAGIKILSGKGAPTSATQGKVNQLYRDENTQKLYICTAVDGGGYTWAAVSGGSVDVDATLTKAGYAADAKAAGDAIEKKLDATALHTAINDALAQAKASGEFDGAKGDKGDTGPEGPKGADGKDGAGMDVTGAKVGQIAKITAVDSTGKPTGWEPVDMPSDVVVVNITSTTDDNGNTTYLSDMTAVEICEQSNQGKVCVAKFPFAFNGTNIPAILNLDAAIPYENNSGASVSFDGLVLNYIVTIYIITGISNGSFSTKITMSKLPASSGPTYVYLLKSDNDPTILNIAPEAGLSIVDLHGLVRQRIDVKLVFEGGVYSLENDPGSGENIFAKIVFKTVNGIEKTMYSCIYVYTGIGGEGASISLIEDEL